MAAMMLPSITPLASLYVRTMRDHRARRTTLLAVGYLVVWGAVGLVAFVVAAGADRLATDAPGWAQAAAIGSCVACAIYQLTPAKERCLRHCRSPLGHLLRYSSMRGRLVDARVGVDHGAWCLACCWSLMVLLVTFGVMNVYRHGRAGGGDRGREGPRPRPLVLRRRRARRARAGDRHLRRSVARARVPRHAGGGGGDRERADRLGGARLLLRGLQLRGDLPVPQRARRARWGLHTRRVLRRAVLARSQGHADGVELDRPSRRDDIALLRPGAAVDSVGGGPLRRRPRRRRTVRRRWRRSSWAAPAAPSPPSTDRPSATSTPCDAPASPSSTSPPASASTSPATSPSRRSNPPASQARSPAASPASTDPASSCYNEVARSDDPACAGRSSGRGAVVRHRLRLPLVGHGHLSERLRGSGPRSWLTTMSDSEPTWTTTLVDGLRRTITASIWNRSQDLAVQPRR